MKTRRRCVLDTNVVVSALLIKNSIPRQAFDKALDEGVILLSMPVLLELDRILSKDKFNKYLRPQERKQFLAVLVREAELIKVTETIQVCRDPDDDKYLELAVCGKADVIITGDGDLLVLNPFRGIKIVTPGEFLKL
ncbi:MAG: putative toxin-antitoxin system toxin component, PIN family [Methanobacteriota archaeon]|nr:MAG: putative toxin-antitoxin system toxin component, PIN family [Euryarchaeota archaeon]